MRPRRLGRPRKGPKSRGKFAKDLRAAREARGMTQLEAAADLGVHWVTWARWETGARRPRGLAVRVVEEWIAASKKRKRRS